MLYAVYAVLTALDILSTQLNLRAGNLELNPLYHFDAWPVLRVVLAAAALFVLAKYFNRRVLKLFCASLAAVVVWNFVLIGVSTNV